MGNPALPQLSTGTPRLWCCEGSSSTHLLFPSSPSFSKTCVLNCQAGARGWNRGEARVHHLGWPSPRKKQQGREGINLGLLPCTSLGQLGRAAMEDTGDSHTGASDCTGTHPLALQAGRHQPSSETRWQCKRAPWPKSMNASPSFLSRTLMAQSQECHNHSGKSK